jgi:hypothetical protein
MHGARSKKLPDRTTIPRHAVFMIAVIEPQIGPNTKRQNENVK